MRTHDPDEQTRRWKQQHAANLLKERANDSTGTRLAEVRLHLDAAQAHGRAGHLEMVLEDVARAQLALAVAERGRT